MFDTVFGLPVHPLVVHATVMLVPVAALLVLACAVLPGIRRRWAWPAVVASALACLTVVAAVESGEPLEHRIGATPQIRHHSSLADLLVAWVVIMSVAMLLLAYVSWYRSGAPVADRLPLPAGLVRALTPARLGGVVGLGWLPPALAALSIVAATGTLVQIVLVGHSGAEAAWSGVTAAHAVRD